MAHVGKWFGFALEEIYDEGLMAFEAGEYDEACEAFGACLQDSNDPSMTRLAKHYLCESHAHSGHARLRDGNFQVAAEEYIRAIALSPNYPDLHLSLARAYQGLGDTLRQIQQIELALELHPNYVDAMLEKGIALYSQGQRKQGIELVEKATMLDAELDADTCRAAIADHKSGHFGEALSLFSALRSRSTTEANRQARVAASHIRNKNLGAAKTAYEKAVTVAPGYADLRCKYGKVLLELGENEKAAEELGKAVEINDRYVEALANLGIAMARLDRDIEAGDCFARALVLDPYHPVATAESALLPARRSMR